MCTVISGDCGCGGSSSSGVTAEGIVATVVVAGAIAALGAVFKVFLIPLGVAIVTAWVLAFAPAWVRRAVFAGCIAVAAGVLWLARQAFRRLRRRPARTVALPREYTATLYLSHTGQNKVIRRGPVPGVWSSPTEVADEVRRRYIAVYGAPAVGELRCHAQPVDDSRLTRSPE